MAYDNVAAVTGLTSARHIREVWDEIVQLDPEVTPFTAILRKLRRKPTRNYQFDHYEAPTLEQRTTSDGGAAADATTVPVADGTVFRNYPIDIVNYTTNEVMTVTNVSTNNLTVTRGVGNSGTGVTITNGDILAAIGGVTAERSSFGNQISVQPTVTYNYTSTFRDDFSMGRRAMKMDLYGGSEYIRVKKDTARWHNAKLEKAFIWSKRQLDTSSSNNTTRFNGFIASIGSGTNVWNVNGNVTKSALDNWLRIVFQYGSRNKVLILNGILLGYIHQLVESFVQTDQERTIFGWKIDRYRSPFGQIPLIESTTLSRAYTTTGYALLLDLDNAWYRPFQDDDTKYFETRPMEDTTKKDELFGSYITDAGLQLFLPTAHGRLYGATGVA